MGFSAITSLCVAIFLIKAIADTADVPYYRSVDFYVVWEIITYLLTILLSFAQTGVYILFTLKARSSYDSVGSDSYSGLKQ